MAVVSKVKLLLCFTIHSSHDEFGSVEPALQGLTDYLFPPRHTVFSDVDLASMRPRVRSWLQLFF